MKGISRKKVGNNTYVYLIKPYRDDSGKYRTHQYTIGKADPVTGKVAYYDEYLEALRIDGLPMPEDALTQAPSAVQEERDTRIVESIRKYGSAWALEQIGEQVGLIPVLKNVFPEKWAILFETACYLTESSEPFLYYEDWSRERFMLPGTEIAHQRISELLDDITSGERDAFYTQWAAILPKDEYVALDITSISSYSELMDQVAWGYNRSKERLAQKNLCLLMGETSQLPLYQVPYEGSLVDVQTLRTTLALATRILKGRRVRVVMDKGFYSSANVLALLAPKSIMDFVLAVPFSNDGFAKAQVDAVREAIDKFDNGIDGLPEAIYGVHRVVRYPGAKGKVHVLVYHNPQQTAKTREQLYALARELRQDLEDHPDSNDCFEKASEYFTIRRSSKRAEGFIMHLREDVIEEEIRYAGWLVLISSRTMTASDGIHIYRIKDVVEKAFDNTKNTFELHRLRVHSDTRADNRLFVGFLAQILVNTLDKRMHDSGLSQEYTKRQVLKKLGAIRCYYPEDEKIISSITKRQRQLLSGLKIPAP